MLEMSAIATVEVNKMMTKILIILIILIGFSVGGFFIYKNVSQPELEEIGAIKEVKKESTTIDVNNTTRAGKLERDEIWSGKIGVVGDILVEEGITLTILPGTKVLISANSDTNNLFGFWECDGIKNYDLLSGTKRENNYNCGVHKNEPYRDEGHHISIIVRGTLKATGTEENRIIFKSDSPNPTIYDWNRLEIYNGILSYANVENYRILETKGDNVEINSNILKNVGECVICANSKAKILFNEISNAGHELIDMHSSSPIIYSNRIGPNSNRSCITIDGGSPQIINNTFEGCGSGISLLVPPSDTAFENNILRNNTFLRNENNIWHAY